MVANHTNGDLNYVAPRLKDTSLYHDYNGGTNDGDRYSITHGIGMWDLKTEDPRVQTIISEYIQSLKACGVDGIRWDAIKHIGLPSEGDSFMKNVATRPCTTMARFSTHRALTLTSYTRSTHSTCLSRTTLTATRYTVVLQWWCKLFYRQPYLQRHRCQQAGILGRES